jgi:recombination protein RecT
MSEALTLINAERDRFSKVCADNAIEFEREANFAMQILNNSEYLMSMAMRNKPSLQAAILNVAAIGISLNPASKLAYLVPRKGAICLDISYMGMMDLAQKTGAIHWGQAVIVKSNDRFELQGIDKPPIHTYDPFATDRGDINGVYVVVKTDTGDYLTHAMPISKVNDIRDRSEAWKAYVKDKKSCPWVTDYEEMAKKTCVKQAAKYWPRRERLDTAIHHMNIEGEEGLAREEKEVGEIEQDKVQSPRLSAKSITSDCMEQLDLDTQVLLRDIADDVKAVMGNPKEALELLHERSEICGVDDEIKKTALWGLFNSQERAALKKAK